MKIESCYATPFIGDVYYNGKQLRTGQAPEGVYKYVSDVSGHTEANRYIVIGKAPQTRVLLSYDGIKQRLTPGMPLPNTQFRLTSERVCMSVLK